MRRLSLQLYGVCIGSLALFFLLASFAWMCGPAPPRERAIFDGLAAMLVDVLPGPGAPRAEVDGALAELGERFRTDLTLRGDDGALLGAVGAPLPGPPPGRREPGWLHRGGGHRAAVRLPDGRWLMSRAHRARHWHGAAWLAGFGLLAVAVAVVAYPVVRRLTRRLERLRAQVDTLGGGDLAARVPVEGRDEVAALATSFNRAAERIERLVGAQRTLLASASHELRSPLARLRMGAELLAGDARPELRERMEKDVAELDALIAELLLASRLDGLESLERREPVDLLGLVAEEAARVGASAEGEPASVLGDPRLLRRLVRNLLENARRHGGDGPVDARVGREEVPGAEPAVRLRVFDRGPGVPATERERIFEPFYRPEGVAEGDGGGFGLGLALVRQIARHHGGEVSCRPRAGGGSCFEVRFT